MLKTCAVILGLALLLAAPLELRGQSQNAPQPNNQPQTAQQPTAPDQRGTEESPAFVKIIPTPKTSAEAAQDAEDRKEKSSSDLWIIRWTGAVAVFTLVLAAVGAWQGIQLKRSVDLLAQAERAQMFVIIQNEHLDMLTQGAEQYPNTPSMDEGFVSDAAGVYYNFKNYGKTPAIIKEISARLIYGKKPADEPIYVPSDQVLREHMIASGEITTAILFDEARPHRCKLEDRMTLGQAKTIIRAQSYVWFYGRILYDDIFGMEHEHRFLWRYGGAHNFRPNYEYPNYIKNT